MADPSTLEIPQVAGLFGSAPPVSTQMTPEQSQREIETVEGPYHGGWMQGLQDPMIQAALAFGLAGGSIPGMFANLATQTAIGSHNPPPIGAPSIMGDYKPPDVSRGEGTASRPTQFAHGRENPEWAGRVDVTDPRTVKGRNLRAPGYYARGGGLGPDWANQTGLYGHPMSHQKSMYGKKTQSYEQPGISSETGPMNPEPLLPPETVRDIITRAQDWQRASQNYTPDEIASASRRIPINIAPTDVNMAMRLYGTPPRLTAPLPTTIVPAGQAWFGAPPTTELPNLLDLFKGVPE